MPQNDPITLQEISQIIIEISSKQKKNFAEENIIWQLYCENPDIEPQTIAKQFNDKVKGACITASDVSSTFRKCKLISNAERAEVLKRAKITARKILNAINNNDGSEIVSIKKELDYHIQMHRFVLLWLARTWETKLTEETYTYLVRMSHFFINDCLDAIIDLIAERTQQPKQNTQINLTTAAYEEKIYQLTVALNRANNLITRLQDSYEEQVIEIRTEEELKIISKLNSEKYGYILDLLISAQNGFKNLRKKGIIPFEIKSAQSLVRRLMEFVEDCAIVPMFEIGERFQVQANELDGYSYEGTPFNNATEIKQVEVISPGWRIMDKEIVISYPRVKEVMEVLVNET